MMLLAGQYQNAYVTRDLERAVALFHERFGVEKVNQFEGTYDITTATGSGTAVMKMAFAWVGNIQYELIEPVSGLVDIYRDVLSQKRLLNFHHISIRTQDWERTRAEIESKALPIVYEGTAPGSKFLFVDTRDTFGHYLEYVWMLPEMWTAWASGR